jgi:hypothetical protein
LLDGRELGLAVVLDRHASRRDRLADGVLDRNHSRAVRVLDRLAELRLGVGDPTVVGDCVRAERVPHALDAGVPLGRRELGRLEPRDRVLDRRRALWGVQPLALRRREYEVQHTALLGRELRLDQVRRPLRVRTGNLELVA